MPYQYNAATALLPKHIWDEAQRLLTKTPIEERPLIQALVGIPDDARDPLYISVMNGMGFTNNLSLLRERLLAYGLRMRMGTKKDLVKDGSAYVFPLEDFKGLLCVSGETLFVFCNSVRIPSWIMKEGSTYKTYQDPFNAIEEVAHNFVHGVEDGVKIELPFQLGGSEPSFKI
jgi:hypothetical protein